MSLNKKPYVRYTIIDNLITNKQKPYPSVEEIIQACYDRFEDYYPSESTILKDIKAMKDDIDLKFYAPIKYSKSRGGYYYSDPEYRLTKMSLNNEEIDALKMMLDVLHVYSGTAVSENFNQAVNKIFASIHEKFPENKGDFNVIQTDNTPSQKGFEFFELFLEAAKKEIAVSMVQYSYRKREFESFIFYPYLLKEFQDKWYVIGYSKEHRKLKTIPLETVFEPILLNHDFKPTDRKKLNLFYRNLYGVYPILPIEKQKIVIRVRAEFSDYLVAHPLHHTQKKTNEFSHGEAFFEYDLQPSFELMNYFYLHSHQIQIISPKTMIEAFNKNNKNFIQYED